MIREVRESDAQAIVDIYNYYILNSTATFEVEPLSGEQMRERIADISQKFPYFVDERDGQIAGYCYAHPWQQRAAYYRTLETTIYVSPHFQKLGVAHGLMNLLINTCRQRGYHALIACITGENTQSIRLHRALGYKTVAEFKEVGIKFGRVLDVVDMELLLEDAPQAEPAK